MDKLPTIRRVIRRMLIFVGIMYALLLVFFLMHVFQVRRENAQVRSVNKDSVVTEVTADIHPRGLLTDSWEKNDAFPGVIINAKIYEMTITNNSGSLMDDWSLEIQIKEDCYVNNAWNGTVEIHQFVDGEEKIQTLDLRNYSEDEIELDYYLAGQDLLIPLSNGDYIIYWPTAKDGESEAEIKSTSDYSGVVNSGIIFYSLSGDVDLSDYVLYYHLEKSYFAGTIGTTFLILLPTWTVLFVICGIAAFLMSQFENRLYAADEMLRELLELCAKMADGKDYFAKGHSLRVGNYAKMIAEHMGMDAQDCQSVYYAALLHDVGNYIVPETIFKRTTKLSNEEIRQMQAHTYRGAELLEDLDSVPYAAEAALSHHEKMDGTGYPSGKKGDEIPLIARIIAVADCFDAMNHDRSYRKKLTKEEIRQEFINGNGTQFDPVVVSAFLDILGDIEE